MAVGLSLDVEVYSEMIERKLDQLVCSALEPFVERAGHAFPPFCGSMPAICVNQASQTTRSSLSPGPALVNNGRVYGHLRVNLRP